MPNIGGPLPPNQPTPTTPQFGQPTEAPHKPTNQPGPFDFQYGPVGGGETAATFASFAAFIYAGGKATQLASGINAFHSMKEAEIAVAQRLENAAPGTYYEITQAVTGESVWKAAGPIQIDGPFPPSRPAASVREDLKTPNTDIQRNIIFKSYVEDPGAAADSRRPDALSQLNPQDNVVRHAEYVHIQSTDDIEIPAGAEPQTLAQKLGLPVNSPVYDFMAANIEAIKKLDAAPEGSYVIIAQPMANFSDDPSKGVPLKPTVSDPFFGSFPYAHSDPSADNPFVDNVYYVIHKSSDAPVLLGPAALSGAQTINADTLRNALPPNVFE